jgi:phage terminase small subunit
MNMTLSTIEGGDGLPPEPDWQSIFDDELDIAMAHELWGVITREMSDAKTISVGNGHAIKRLIEFHVQYEHASRHVAEKGAILAPTSKKAKVGQWNPFWSVMRQADDAMKVLESELGISPLRRGKATKAERTQRKSRPSDAFLRQTGG